MASVKAVVTALRNIGRLPQLRHLSGSKKSFEDLVVPLTVKSASTINDVNVGVEFGGILAKDALASVLSQFARRPALGFILQTRSQRISFCNVSFSWRRIRPNKTILTTNRHQQNRLACCCAINVLLVVDLASRATDVPPGDRCDTCRFLARSFEKGFNDTNKSHFEGGNTAWENENLGKYSTSETRFIEIMELICSKKSKHVKEESKIKNLESKCHAMAEEYEETLETWYYHNRKEYPDLFDWFCIKTVKVCCPDNTFGASCAPCPGDPKRPCFGNGICEVMNNVLYVEKFVEKKKINAYFRAVEADLDRENVNVTGDIRENCAGTVIVIFSKFIPTKRIFCVNVRLKCAITLFNICCTACHESCKGGCNGEGPKECHSCRAGWIMDEDTGCKDIDECESSPCTDQFEKCENTPGSYKCVCAEAFRREDGVCIPDPDVPRPKPVFFGLLAQQVLRYASYFGLLLSFLLILLRPKTPLIVLFTCSLVIIALIEAGHAVRMLNAIFLGDQAL
ncbi:Cysteine-rich with EGF-like domain protein 1 [Trichinella pseudospiralis]|uniref:Cysteine-rich with EGF-like domain protein 1 n=1 Tax=Trichinella pseudospiralis TaxID=6337 RepID=A0A0V0Y008_TRIPS|nr:Cysteine-rich with EGF-like domain protein 1 [Trichinella pseudospiralis]